MAELKECISETASGMGAAALVEAPLLERRCRRMAALTPIEGFLQM
jgi:hypothetical protein